MAGKFPFVVPDFGELWQPKITLLPCGFGVADCDLFPDLAEFFLSVMVENQRRPREALRVRYAADMAADRWEFTHQGVAFNRAGQFFDGQNRCLGVVQSGATVRVLVFFGVGGADEMSVTDTGGARTTSDAARVQGVRATPDDIATVRAWFRYNGGDRQQLSHSAVLDLVAEHAEKLSSVAMWFTSNKVRGADRASVRAAVFAALLAGRDPVKLARFAQVVTDNAKDAPAPGDSGPRLLRHFIIKYLGNGQGGGAVDKDLFLRACKAVEGVLAGHEIQQLKPCAENPFPYRPRGDQKADRPAA